MCHQSDSATCRSPHPQTPINRSLPKAFQGRPRHQDILGQTKTSQGRPRHREEILSSEVQKLCWNQALKPPGTSRTSTLNTKNIRREIIQIIFLDLKGHWNQAQKPLETSTNHKLAKLYGFNPPKPQRTSITNLQIRRTFEEESSKSYSQISKFTGIKLKSLQKPQQTTNQ